MSPVPPTFRTLRKPPLVQYGEPDVNDECAWVSLMVAYDEDWTPLWRCGAVWERGLEGVLAKLNPSTYRPDYRGSFKIQEPCLLAARVGT